VGAHHQRQAHRVSHPVTSGVRQPSRMTRTAGPDGHRPPRLGARAPSDRGDAGEPPRNGQREGGTGPDAQPEFGEQPQRVVGRACSCGPEGRKPWAGGQCHDLVDDPHPWDGWLGADVVTARQCRGAGPAPGRGYGGNRARYVCSVPMGRGGTTGRTRGENQRGRQHDDRDLARLRLAHLRRLSARRERPRARAHHRPTCQERLCHRSGPDHARRSACTRRRAHLSVSRV
jgi:hypothetical protein